LRLVPPAVVETAQKLKDFLQHRRRDQPGWQLSQAEVDLAADLLAPYCRFTPRLIYQATGGSLGTLSDLLDVWWRIATPAQVVGRARRSACASNLKHRGASRSSARGPGPQRAVSHLAVAQRWQRRRGPAVPPRPAHAGCTRRFWFFPPKEWQRTR
jgi:hypothetical protein